MVNDMLKYKLYLACLLLVCVACNRVSKDEKIKLDFEQYTLKECPKHIDPCTRLDSACYNIETRTIAYYYTVQDDLDNEELYTDELIETLYEDKLKSVKGSLQLKQYKDEGIAFCYEYRSTTTGKTLLQMTFSPEDYGK